MRLDPAMGRLVAGGAVPVLRKRPAGFEGLAQIVTGQQVSTASAAAIWGRLRDRVAPLTAATISRTPRTRCCRAAGPVAAEDPDAAGRRGGRPVRAACPSTASTRCRPTRRMRASSR